MVSHSRPYFLWLCVVLLPDWHCEEEVLGKHPASLLPIVCGVDTILNTDRQWEVSLPQSLLFTLQCLSYNSHTDICPQSER